MTGRYTEHDYEHYERPRRHTRPRTKDRPTHDDAVDAMVMTVDRGRYTLLVDGPTVVAMKARPLGRKGVVVGDRVRVVGDMSGADGALARIVDVDERTHGAAAHGRRRRPGRAGGRRQRRPAGRRHGAGRPRAAAAAHRPGLVAAFDAGMRPLLCLTKADLAARRRCWRPTARWASRRS